MKRLIIVSLCLFLCGCRWRDAGELSAVTAGAITQPQADSYTLTAELALPSSDSAVPNTMTVSGHADTVVRALDRAGAGRDTQLYWSHARVMLFGTELLQNGIAPVLTELTHFSEVRPSVRLFVLRNGSAEDFFSCKSISGDPVGFALGGSMRRAVRHCQTPDAALYQILDRVQGTTDAVLPAVSIRQKLAVLDGSALLHGDTVCGWLEQEQTAPLCILMQSGDTAAVYDDTTRYVLTHIRTSVKNKAICVQADVACENNRQAQRAARTLQTQCTDVVQTLQQTGCDALGLRHSIGSHWQSVSVPVRIDLHSTQSTEGGAR